MLLTIVIISRGRQIHQPIPGGARLRTPRLVCKVTRLTRLRDAENMVRAAAADLRPLTAAETDTAATEIRLIIDRLIWNSNQSVSNDG